MPERSTTEDLEKRIRALEAEIARYRVLLTQIGYPMGIFDRDGILLMMNDRAAAYLEGKPDDFIGRTILDLFPANGDLYLERIDSAFGNDRSEEYVDKVDLPAGVRWFRSVCQPLRDENDILYAVLIYSEDITPRMAALKDLDNSEARFRLLANMAPAGIYMTDAAGDCIYVNNAWQKMAGMDLEEAVGKGWENALHPEDRAAVLDSWYRYREDDKDFWQEEYRYQDKDGRVTWVFGTSAPMTDDSGRTTGYMGVNFDITDRKRTEAELRGSEERYRFLTENMIDIVWTMDLALNTVYVSPSVERILGYTPDERRHQKVDEVVTPESLQQITKVFEDELRRDSEGADPDRSIAIEVEYYKKDGSTLWMENQVKALRDDDGEMIQLFGVSRDISEKRKVEQALRESEERYRSVIDHMGTGVAIYEAIEDGRDFIFRDINPAGARIGQLDRGAHISRPVTEVYPGVEALGILDVFRRVHRTGEPEIYPLSHYEDGRITLWVENYVCKLPSGEIVAVYDDVTESKRATEALSESEEKYRLIFERSPLGVIHFDTTGTIIDCNESFADIIGVPRERLIGFNMLRNMPEGDARNAIEEALENGDGYFEGDYHTVTGDKDVVIRAFHRRLTTKTGKVIGGIGLFEDISEKIRMEKQLQRAQRMEAIGTLAGGIAHDFNNILASIIGFAELMIDDLPADSQDADFAREIDAAGKRARDLVRNMLTYARRVNETPRPVRIRDIVDETLHFLRSTVPASIQINPRLNSGSLVMADPTQVHQIVMNLCTNAVHAMEADGGVLTIGLEDITVGAGADAASDLKPGRYVHMSFADTGHGMSPEVLDHIFDPYFTTKELGEGTGMGLAVVLGAVENAGGIIRVVSAIGRGTTFDLFFPVSQIHEDEPADGAEIIPMGRERILFVDDEAPIVKHSTRMLGKLGYQVQAMTGSRDALEAFRSAPDAFDLVITDLAMPDISGDVLASRLLRIRPDIPIILCTGFSKKMTESQAAELGIRAFVMKPLVKYELANVIRKVLDQGDTS